MNKLLVGIIIICLITIQTGYCNAETSSLAIEIIDEGQFSFYYQGEEKNSYKMLKNDNNTVYLNSRQNETIDSQLSQKELYGNEQLEEILEYGYPNKSKEELGVNSDFEAYVATQEAIYYFIENKNLDLYKAEDENGQRIIDAIVRIIARIGEQDVEIIEETEEWIEYEDESDKHYKEYKVNMKKEISSATIKLVDAQEGKIIKENGEIATQIKNNEKIRVVVPKDIDQIFQLQVEYVLTQPILYIANSTTSQTQYIITDLQEKDKNYQLQVESQNLVNIVIRNYQKETNEPIQGNMFEILDKNQNGYIAMLTTDKNGEIQMALLKGKYYLKQVYTTQGEPQKQLLPIEVKGTEKVIELNIYNMEQQTEEATVNEKEINVTEENKIINENYVKDVMNIHTTNIEKEIVNQTNETNLNNVNYFINTINKKNTLNLNKENYYKNKINEQSNNNQILGGQNQELQVDRDSYNSYIDSIKVGTIDIPNLPVASKE